MNKSTQAVKDYLAAMPLTEERSKAFSVQLAADEAQDLAALHRQMGAFDTSVNRLSADDVALASVKMRIKSAWPDAVTDDDFATDPQGRFLLKATPPIKRTSMFPEAWCTNPLARFWHALCGRKVPRRRASKKEATAEERWRSVGSIRRYVLLVLILLQTGIATWYMKTILPYQGWALLNPLALWNQELMPSVLQLLPYVLQAGILILFAILFCWVSAGFWTALMGFLQLLIGKDKYSISSTIKGDEPLNPAHRTALIMPICNEDVERVFAGLRATYESVAATGQLEHFDIYVLSDSDDPDTCVAEQKAWMELCHDVGGRIFYRRRRRRVKRKRDRKSVV